MSVAEAGAVAAGLLLPSRILEERRIPPARYESYHRQRYAARPLRKVAFFVRSEGLAAAWRKARSKRIERRLQRAQAIVVARPEVGGRVLVGVTRDIGAPLHFPAELLFEPIGDESLDALALSSRALTLLESYVPVAGCPLPPELAEAILADNSWLRAWSGNEAPGHRSQAPAEGVAVPLSAGATRRDGAHPRATSHGGRSRARGDVFLLGFGAYVRDQVLHHFRDRVRVAVDHRAGLLRRQLRTPFLLTDSVDAGLEEIAGAERPLVIIATYHADHAPLALRVLEANASARVFVEKPPAVTLADAERLAAAAAGGAWVDVGFNRRWAALTRPLAAACALLPRPLLVTATVQELPLPETHWYFWPNQGTRITGNGCHWIDLLHYLLGGPPEELTLTAGDSDTICLGARWSDGSLASLVATDRGATLAGVTERIEVRGGGTTIVLDDYRRLRIEEASGTRTWRTWHRDKGHDAMYRDLRRRSLTGDPPRYPTSDIVPVTRVVATASAMWLGGERARRLASPVGAA